MIILYSLYSMCVIFVCVVCESVHKLYVMLHECTAANLYILASVKSTIQLQNSIEFILTFT